MSGCDRKQNNHHECHRLQTPGPAMPWRGVVVMVMMMAVVTVDVSGQAPCSLDDVIVLDDFDVNKFLGKWFEIEWIAPAEQDSGNMWANYYNVYTADEFGILNGYYSGKDPKTGECFLGGIANLKSNTHPAKMMQYTQWSETETSLNDYWILETDYTSYAVAYSCVQREKDSNTTCKTARSWLWSRTKSLPLTIIHRARSTFRVLCMNVSLLYTTEFIGDDCEPESSGAVTTTKMNGNYVILLLAPSMMLLMFLKDLSRTTAS